MKEERSRGTPLGLESDWLGRWILRLPAIERPILFLRWFSLLLVLGLHFLDPSTAGVLFPTPYMVAVVAGYNGLLLLLMRYVRWLTKPLNYLALDTVVATLAVYLTGGYHSSFFVLYIFIAIGAAFQLDLTRTVMVSLAIGLIEVGACYVNPAGLHSIDAQIIVTAKVMGLLIVGVLCGLLLEQLRREHQETERERALAQRLKALNDLFHHLNTSLDLEHTLQTVAEAPQLLLDADVTSIALLDEKAQSLSIAASTGANEARLVDQTWPVAGTPIADIMQRGQLRIVGGAEDLSGALPMELLSHNSSRSVKTIALVPLSLDDKPLGLLSVGYYRGWMPTEEETSFLQALGQEAALAIRNARLYSLEREQVARLRNLAELQDAFVSAVSHELRTPLTCIRTSADLLRATSAGLAEEQGDLIRTIGHHVSRLEGLVSDLLEATRLDAGQVTLFRQPTDLRELVQRVVDALRPLVARKGQTIRVILPEAIDTIDLDRRRIEQVLTNILTNAIKFTPKRGSIEVELQDSPERVTVRTTDTGPGIPEEERTRVFDRFYVVSDGRGLSGVGLGLYIARQMVELHGGQIWIEGGVGHGSTFCFALPKSAGRGNDEGTGG